MAETIVYLIFSQNIKFNRWLNNFSNAWSLRFFIYFTPEFDIIRRVKLQSPA